MDEQTKETLERAIELARENTRKLQSPMPHTLRRKKRLGEEGTAIDDYLSSDR